MSHVTFNSTPRKNNSVLGTKRGKFWGVKEAFEQGKKLGDTAPTPDRINTRQDIISSAIRRHVPVPVPPR